MIAAVVWASSCFEVGTQSILPMPMSFSVEATCAVYSSSAIQVGSDCIISGDLVANFIHIAMRILYLFLAKPFLIFTLLSGGSPLTGPTGRVGFGQ